MKILIADDHPLVRDALARTLRALEPQAELVEAGDFSTAAAALADAAAAAAALADPKPPPMLAVLDLRMPGMQGTDGVRRLHAMHPGVRLMVLSGEDEPAVIRAAYAAGAVAFVPKSEPPEVLQQALRAVLDGGQWMPAHALADLRSGAGLPRNDLSALTPRQTDVLRCLQRGLPNKLIARELGLTEGTVKIHIAAILRALGARNRTEAVVIARKLGGEL